MEHLLTTAFINNVSYTLHMEQKDYKLEIIDSLIGKSWHVRGLAKQLGVNHMLLFRKFRELYNENVFDYKKEWKNKVYFLKKTIEARAYLFMTENYKLIQLLRKYPNLRKIIEEIQSNLKIKLAVLFGSYAKDLAKKDSDVDIYIETTDKKIKEEIERLSSKVNIKVGKYDKGNLLIKEIEKNHVIIKGVEIFYEKFKFFD